MSKRSDDPDWKADRGNALKGASSKRSDGFPSKPIRDEAQQLREEIQQMTWDARKALAWVGASLAAIIYLITLLPDYPTWTVLFFVPLAVFLVWNWGDWRSGRRTAYESTMRLGCLEKQIEEKEH